MSQKSVTLSTGAGGGGLIACILSWALNHSFWWALLHFFMGWFYVLYALIVRSKEIIPALKVMFGA